MITILCVLKSGGVYDAEWVAKLKRGVERHLPEHQFVCLSDVDVPCHRMELQHGWPGWWSKIELFNGAISGPTLYLDLDTVITGPMDKVLEACQDHSFAMLQNFSENEMVGSGVMWFAEKPPHGVYERFLQDPQRVMDHYHRVRLGSYRGDQAFVYDSLDRKVDKISSKAIRSYKMHCRNGLPEGTSIVCFHGRPRPSEVNAAWMRANWV